MKIELNDQERRAVGRLLAERKALLIEMTEDTTQPDSARRSGSIELSVIESILGKLSLRDLTSTGAADLSRPVARRGAQTLALALDRLAFNRQLFEHQPPVAVRQDGEEGAWWPAPWRHGVEPCGPCRRRHRHPERGGERCNCGKQYFRHIALPLVLQWVRQITPV